MASKRVNVLVYTGIGSTVESVRHCLYSLRRLLSPNYAVIPITSDALLKEPWSASCVLLVMPGGADLGYCRVLNGEGNRRITQFVNQGGAYLGFCAGGYYGSKRCEWEAHDEKIGVVGDRELGFFPGICRGLAFPGFVYHSEAGARAVELKTNKTTLASAGGSIPDIFRVYYNGGGVFVDAEKFKDRGVEILASYTENLHVDSGEGKAAVVYKKIGEGGAIVTGPHPEFAAINLNKTIDVPGYSKVVEDLRADDKLRADFFKSCLLKLGLRVAQEEQEVPSLSRLHLCSSQASEVADLVSSWADLITTEAGEEYIKGEQDIFHLQKPFRWSMRAVKDAVTKTAAIITTDSSNEAQKPDPDHGSGSSEDNPAEEVANNNIVIKTVVAHDDAEPSNKETPYFNHAAYFSNLASYNVKNSDYTFGRYLLYGEVVTSTNTILEKNIKLLSRLPQGFTFTATTQVAGRGRGNNVWVSPPGSLMFSTVLRHPLSLSSSAPVVFVQYLVALAIVQGITSYDRGYDHVPVRLKWPNDVYALDPSATGPEANKRYVKIGGILVNSSYSGVDFTLVVGVGLNVTNAAPTTSLNALLGGNGTKGLQAFTLEKLLARILTCFEQIYAHFCRRGWDDTLNQEYLKWWLHSDQIVTLETEGGARARIKGITRDYGLLLAEELGWEDRKTGKTFELQSDSNSFDFFKGLLKRKS
ncbi:MAG: biotin holocarboxylase synthetase [Bogoriella megaspora]|nr:MAG: biotin holocarboxylase synthetase [Bogoriella megaspora]